MQKLIILLTALISLNSMSSIAQEDSIFKQNQTADPEIIIPDFQVNENAGTSVHTSPDIATGKDGEMVVVWIDHRTGRPDIYARRYSSDGTPQGSSFRVNDDPTGAYHGAPCVAVDGNGNFIVAWIDERDGEENNIYAQRYLSDGTPAGNNFRVDDDLTEESHYDPSIAADGTGLFVIVWEDYRNGNQDVYAQRYWHDGLPIGSNFKVNDDTGTGSQDSPSVSMDWQGNFVIAWKDYREGKSNIYAQRYTRDGSILGSNFIINDNSGYSRYFDPCISSDSTGNFIVVWDDGREYSRDIFAQLCSSDGTTIGKNFKVNDDTKKNRHLGPDVSMNTKGNIVVTWYDEREGYFNIYAQRYTKEGSPIGGNLLVNDDSGTSWQQVPAVCMDKNGNFTLVWQDNRELPSQIFAQQYASDRSKLGSNFKVNDDTGSSQQLSPRITVDQSGHFVIAWVDERNGRFDIFAQRFSDIGTALDMNFKVNDDTGYASQNMPDIASDTTGNFIIVWQDVRDSYAIMAQRYLKDGSLLGANFKVNDDTTYESKSEPSVSIDDSGNVIIVWEDKRNGNTDIYAQALDNNGLFLGNNFKINDDTGEESQRCPCISVNHNGSFVIAWEDRRNGNSDIYAQRYGSDRLALGDNFMVNEDPGSEYQGYPDIASDLNSNFIIAWEDYRHTNLDIYVQQYLNDGSPSGNNIKVNSGSDDKDQGSCSAGMDEKGNFLIVWEDERNAPYIEVYGQRYSSDGSPLGGNFLMTNKDKTRQMRPDIVLNDNRIYHTWQDNRAGLTGYDIWASVLDWTDPTGNIDQNIIGNIMSFFLNQNYPNPFNPKTTISFSLQRNVWIKLKVYNVLGEIVDILVDEYLSAGFYHYQWPVKNVPSGIYYCLLETEDYSKVKKMVLVR
jgi:hypothetical protein